MGRRNRFLGSGLLAAVLATAGFALGGGFTVTLGPLGPQPANLAVNWGDTVTFTNTDTVEHGLLFIKRAPRSGATTTTTTTTTTPAANVIPPGGTFTGVFDGKKGKYAYKEVGTVTTKSGTKQKNFPGVVFVNLSGTVTLKVSARTVVYRQPVDLTGRSTLLGFPVVIQERDPDDEWEDVLTAQTAADGTFLARLVPEIGASFRATAAAGQLVSSKVKVEVKPVITIRVSSRRAMTNHVVRVIVTVEPDEDAVTSVELLRSYNPQHPTQVRWKPLISRMVNADGVAVFKVRALRGRSLLRAQVSRLGLEPGYSPAQTAVVSVTGVGGPPPKTQKKKTA